MHEPFRRPLSRPAMVSHGAKSALPRAADPLLLPQQNIRVQLRERGQKLSHPFD
jgi:hypothetical protein